MGHQTDLHYREILKLTQINKIISNVIDVVQLRSCISD